MRRHACFPSALTATMKVRKTWVSVAALLSGRNTDQSILIGGVCRRSANSTKRRPLAPAEDLRDRRAIAADVSQHGTMWT